MSGASLMPQIAPVAPTAWPTTPADVSRVSWRAVQAWIACTVVLQRLAVPGTGGNVPLILPVSLAIFGVLLVRGDLREHPTRAGAYVAVMGTCAATALATSIGGQAISLSSIALLITLYAPFAFSLHAGWRRHSGRMLDFFSNVVAMFAVVAVVQSLVQLRGLGLIDPLASLPAEWLVPNFNTTYPVVYGSPILKANGMVFLEPSFLSQYLALATVATLLTRRGHWRIPLYLAAMLASVAGTGVLLLAVGTSLVMVRRGGRWAARSAALIAVVVIGVGSTPVGQHLLDRRVEVGAEESSFSARFVLPYQRTPTLIGEDTLTRVAGLGPGAADVDALDYWTSRDIPLIYPVVPKAITEYGLLGGSMLVAFMVLAFLHGAPSKVMALTLLWLHLALSASLLQPATVVTAYVLSSMFASPAPSQQAAGQLRR